MVEKSRKTVGMRRSVRVAYENRSAKLVVSARLTKFCPLFRHTSRRQGDFFAYGLRNLTVGAPGPTGRNGARSAFGAHRADGVETDVAAHGFADGGERNGRVVVAAVIVVAEIVPHAPHMVGGIEVVELDAPGEQRG